MTLMFIDVYRTRMQLEILKSLAYSFHKQFRITILQEARKKKRLERQYEWSRLLQDLHVSESESTQSAHAEFFNNGDQYARSCYFISCWSHCENRARKIAKCNDKAMLSIKKSDLRSAFQESASFWNSKQPDRWDMLNSDFSQNLDWDPRYIEYATGPLSYVELNDPSSTLPFRLERAMHLPKKYEDEKEWRIALDLSLVPSSFTTSSLLQAELMLSSICQLGHMANNSHLDHSDSSQAELEPMIEIKTNNLPDYERGLWLNCCDLSAQDSFKIYTV